MGEAVEAIGRFAHFADSGVPTFGGDNPPFGTLDRFNLGGMSGRMSMLHVLPYQTFGGLALLRRVWRGARAGAGAGVEILATLYTTVDPNILGGGLVGSPSEWEGGASQGPAAGLRGEQEWFWLYGEP